MADRRESNEKILKRIQDRYDYGLQASKYNTEQGDEDMRSLSVDGNWPEQEARRRRAAKLPMGHTDIISPNNDRVVNQFNMHPRGIKVVESGPTATSDTATMRESRIREIEVENDAPSIYGSMLQNTVDRGIGYFKISTERKSPVSFNQKIVMERILNVKAVVDDPDTRKADRSDRRFLFHIDKWYDEDEFIKEFPDAEVRSFSAEVKNQAPKWFKDKRILVAQYYEVEKTKDMLLELGKNTKPILESNLPEDAKYVNGKKGDLGYVLYGDGRKVPCTNADKSEKSQVWIYLTNGVDILEERTLWIGTTIPFPTATGREKIESVNGLDQLVTESMTRKMRHPSMMYDFIDAAEREAFGLVLKAKLLTAAGQVEDFPEWKDPFRTNRANLRYKHKIEGDVVPPPIHIQSSVDVEQFEVAKQSRIRDGQNAIGMSSADQKDRISKSGVAQRQIDQAGDIASFHHIASANRAIRFGLQIIHEILDKVEDTSRTAGFREADGSYQQKELKVIEAEDGSTQHPYGSADDHSLNIETGPGYQSQSDKADDFIASFIAPDEQLKVRVADLAIKQARLGPLGDQMAERVKPADITQKEEAEKNGQQPMPPQAIQMIQGMKEHMAQTQMMLAEATKIIDGKIVENDSKKEIEIEKAKLQVDLAKFNKFMDYKIAMTKVNATAASDAAYIQNEKELLAEQHNFETDMSMIEHHQGMTQADRQHQQTTDLTAMGQQHEAGMADMGHQNAMELQAEKPPPKRKSRRRMEREHE